MSDDYYTTPDGRPGITVRPQGDDDDDVEGLRRLLTLTPDLSRGSGIELLDKLIGAGGKQRFQTWPERMIRSAATLPGQVASGEIPTYLPSVSDDPSRADFTGNAVGGRVMNPEITQRVMDMGGIAGLGAMPAAERGAVGMAGGKLIQPAKEAPVFYSGVERAIEAAPQAKMTPQQWSGYLRNQPGVKAEELQWLGLDDHTAWPGELNKGAVTKDQLLEHAEGHGVKIKEVEKKTDGPDHIHEDDIMNRQEQAVEDAFHQRYPNYADLGPGHPEYDRAYDHFQDSMVAHHIRDEINMENNAQNHTKFSDYQLPGGDNYRELLLTLPETIGPVQKRLAEIAARVDQITKLPARETDPKTPNGQALLAEFDRLNTENTKLMRSLPKQEQYRSSHWDEPNVLAHVRMNDRTLPGPKTERLRELENKIPVKDDDPPLTPNDASEYAALVHDPDAAGLKSLHLEEIQSDWHQAGRKKGYASDKGKPVTEAEVAEYAKRRYDEIAGQGSWDRSSEAQQARILQDMREYVIGTSGNVPDAPFKQSWPDLALKRAVAKAAREGYDAVSWTPGEQQAARYDLSKQVSRLHLTHNREGAGLLQMHLKDGRVQDVPIGNNQKSLADVVGKDLAEKLYQQGNKNNGVATLEGLDLKVGGEGMERFYDKMLVDKANALGKKFGAKVEWKDLPGQRNNGPVSGDDVMEHMNIPDKDRTRYWADLSQASRDQLMEAFRNSTPTIKVPTLRLTPGLRDAATKRGFPLFARGLPFTFTPVDHDPFSDKERK